MSLPSIQFLLDDERHSTSALPTELQQLSIPAPKTHSRSRSDLILIKPAPTVTKHRRTISATSTIVPHIDTKPQAPCQKQLLLNAVNNALNITRNDEPSFKYTCSVCQKSFNRPSSLKIHTYSHTGEKPFVCPVKECGRQFSVQSNMRRHMRIHIKK